MYDDIFILQNTTVEDLKINWARCEVTNIDEYLQSKMRTGTTGYKASWKTTYEFIYMLRSGMGKKTYDWETHTPRFFNKSNLKDMLDRYDFSTLQMMPQAIYDGFHADNTQIITSEIQSDMWSHKPFMDFGKEFAKNYMNIYDNVIVPEFIEHMKEKFG
ncbi:MAG: hypothetical protein GY706_02085 [Bacteroides sp.]|nr:hypothetical protein [Bacteroides sp.]